MATRDYTLGKGKLLFSSASRTGPWEDLGNAPAVNLTMNIEKKEHVSSREGLGLKDLEVITKTAVAGSFTLDEPNTVTLRKFFMDDDTADTDQAAGTKTLADITVTHLNVDKWIEIVTGTGYVKTNGSVTANAGNVGTAVAWTLSGTQTADATHTYDIMCTTPGASTAAKVVCRRDGGAWSDEITVTDESNFNITYTQSNTDSGLDIHSDAIVNAALGDIWSFTVTAVSGGVRVWDIDPDHATTFAPSAGGTLVSGTDYVLDANGGLIMFLSSSTYFDGNLNPSGGTPVTVTMGTCHGLASTKGVLRGFSKNSISGYLKFVGNPSQGIPIDVYGKASVTPNGDLSLIGEDWMSMQFNIEFLQDGTNPLVSVETRTKTGLLA